MPDVLEQWWTKYSEVQYSKVNVLCRKMVPVNVLLYTLYDITVALMCMWHSTAVVVTLTTLYEGTS